MVNFELTNCYYCNEYFTLLSTRVLVRKAIKPKNTPYRWKIIWHCCELCGDTRKLSFEYNEVING